jgi:hypothetical protein
MNGSSPPKHGRPQGHRARFGFVQAFFGFGFFFGLPGSCFVSRLRFRLGDLRRNAFPSNALSNHGGFRGRSLGYPRAPDEAWLLTCGSGVLFLFLNSRSSAVAVRRGRQGGMRFTAVVPAQLIGFVFVDRTGVGDLFRNAKFVQFVDDLARLHFQLPRQFIDANLTHNLKRFV